MLLEAARPIALLLCMVALCALFHTAFLGPANVLEQRAWDSLTLLSLAAGICLASAMLFRDPGGEGAGSLLRTLPVQMFCWSVGLMVVLFVASWYLETHCVFYRDVRRF
jgi:hypothetical protein